MKYKLKAILRSIIIASVFVMASCNPVYAGSLCGDVSGLAVNYAEMQYFNNESVARGMEPKFNKEAELARVNAMFNGKHLGLFELAVNYGFSNPAGTHRMKMHVFEMMYSQCQHWLHMNNLNRY